MNPRGGVKRDPCPEDLLSVAENCLDLLMRPDKELCPGRATLAPRLCAEGANGEEKEGGEERAKGGEENVPKVGFLHWRLTPSTGL